MIRCGFSVRLSADDSVENQDEEYFFIEMNGNERRIRFHDYEEIYKIPGLYEHLFYDRLRCESPQVVADLLENEIEETPRSMSDLKVLDLGAGNGIVGKVLNKKGVNSIVGVDIIDEAAAAAKRDRPGIYDDYLVEDFSDIDDNLRNILEKNKFNCLTCVAALGFNDIPSAAFANGFNLLQENGMVAFNIKPDFVEDGDSTGFAYLIKEIVAEDILELKSEKRYCHRLSMNGDPINYVAMVGMKKAEIPEHVCREL
ncbi:MAG: class I SAM-dependent methyltransferase [Thermoleophilia bacterium]|nr:class I SAM-dependent methyltransferase [Thermoleophilia bacterium]